MKGEALCDVTVYAALWCFLCGEVRLRCWSFELSPSKTAADVPSQILKPRNTVTESLKLSSIESQLIDLQSPAFRNFKPAHPPTV
jgi:hypothetical protein